MFQQQPMKVASAEALCNTEQAAAFSVFAVGDTGGIGRLDERTPAQATDHQG
jgi:cytochrome d ubiquinol oxidase subunit I